MKCAHLLHTYGSRRPKRWARDLQLHARICTPARLLALVHEGLSRVGRSFIGSELWRPYDEDDGGTKDLVHLVQARRKEARESPQGIAPQRRMHQFHGSPDKTTRETVGEGERDSFPSHAWINNLFHIYITTTGTPQRGVSKWEVLDRLGLRIRNLFCKHVCSMQFIIREYSWQGRKNSELTLKNVFTQVFHYLIDICCRYLFDNHFILSSAN